jgi:hypothetical protein
MCLQPAGGDPASYRPDAHARNDRSRFDGEKLAAIVGSTLDGGGKGSELLSKGA